MQEIRILKLDTEDFYDFENRTLSLQAHSKLIQYDIVYYDPKEVLKNRFGKNHIPLSEALKDI